MSFILISSSASQPSFELARCGLCGCTISPYLPIAGKQTRNRTLSVKIGRCQECSSLWDLDSLSSEHSKDVEFQVSAHEAVYAIPQDDQVLAHEINKRKKLADSLIRHCNQKPSRILDFGCGNGLLAIALSENAECVFAYDLNIDAALDSIQRCQALNVRPIKTICEIADRSIDLVVAWHVLEHLADPSSFFEQIIRIASPASTLIIQVPCLTPEYLIDAHIFFPTIGTFEYIQKRWGFETCHLNLDADNNFATYVLQSSVQCHGK